MRIFELHLRDNVTVTPKEVAEYLTFVLRSENEDLFKIIDDKVHSIYDRILNENYGKNWEILMDPKWESVIKKTYFTFPIDNIRDFLLTQEKAYCFGDGDFNYYTTPRKYPLSTEYMYHINQKIEVSESLEVSWIWFDIMKLKYDLVEKLINKKFINKFGILEFSIWEEVKTVWPEFFDWWVERLIKKENYDEVKEISVKEDLEELKRWMPGATI